MTWADFYLICFAVGFALSLFSFIGDSLHWHLPHAAHGHFPTGHAGAAGKSGVRGDHVSPFNFVSLAAFLAWFGGTGFLLTRFSSFAVVTGLSLSVFSGLFGGLIIFLFLSRVLTSEAENLDPADFEMTGVLGRLSVSIRAQGTGELVYSQAGTRRTCGARAEDGCEIAKGSEVVVTHYEKGIAYVRRWEEISGEENVPANDATAQKGSTQ